MPSWASEMGVAPRVQGPGVIDMQQAILKRLRSEIDRLKTERTEIIANSKQNQIVQNRIQAAVISIIQATTFEKMIHVVTHELPELLDVDFITMAIEANADAPKRVPVRGVYVLAPGAIDAAIGPDKHARLRADIAGEDAFFGEVSRFVKSDVLMRLRVSSGSPDGVMCFGARDPEAFGPEMSTELLFFLCQGAGEHHPRLARPAGVTPHRASPRRRAAWRDWLQERTPLLAPHAHRLRARRGDLPRLHDELSRRRAHARCPRQAEARRVPRLAGRTRRGRAWRAPRRRAPSPRCARSFGSSTRTGSPTMPASASIQTPKLPRSVPKALCERDMEDLLEAPGPISERERRGSTCATRPC